MSGGVDSSLAARLTKDVGFDCVGCTMRLYNKEDIGLSREHVCCSLEDVEDARNVACKRGRTVGKTEIGEGSRRRSLGA